MEKLEHTNGHKNMSAYEKTKILLLENKLLIVSCVMLGIAVIRFGWYIFYMLTRLVVFIIMIALFIKNYKYKLENEKKLWLFWITAFVYNPIFSIYLNRGFWIIIDIVLIVLFIQAIKQNKKFFS